MQEKRECKKHGVCDFVIESKGTKNQRFRCKKCRQDAVTKRRRKLKVDAIAYLGGKCSICGYDRCIAALEFHHKDPAQKDFAISGGGVTRSWNKIKEELDKCILLCSNCHREIHSE